MHTKAFFFFLLIVLLPNVSALGVSPGKVEINFLPNLNSSFIMSVVNSPARVQDVKIYVSYSELDRDVVEEFGGIISLEKESLSFNEEEGTKTLNVALNLPAGFSKQGVHELRVGAMKESAEGQFSIVAGNEIRVLINVSEEYASDKYARIKRLKILNMQSPDIKKGDFSNITILVKSESDVSLPEVYAKIRVLKGSDEITTLETNKISLEPGEEGFLVTAFNSQEFSEGTLLLDAEVFYDSKSEKIQGTLNIIGEEKPLTETARLSKWVVFIIVLFVILLILIIILLIFLLLRKKQDKNQNPAQKVNSQNL